MRCIFAFLFLSVLSHAEDSEVPNVVERESKLRVTLGEGLRIAGPGEFELAQALSDTGFVNMAPDARAAFDLQEQAGADFLRAGAINLRVRYPYLLAGQDFLIPRSVVGNWTHLSHPVLFGVDRRPLSAEQNQVLRRAEEAFSPLKAKLPADVTALWTFDTMSEIPHPVLFLVMDHKNLPLSFLYSDDFKLPDVDAPIEVRRVFFYDGSLILGLPDLRLPQETLEDAADLLWQHYKHLSPHRSRQLKYEVIVRTQKSISGEEALVRYIHIYDTAPNADYADELWQRMQKSKFPMCEQVVLQDGADPVAVPIDFGEHRTY